MRNMAVFISSQCDDFSQRPSVVYTDCMDDGIDSLLERANYMKSEKNRFESFKNWPLYSSQSPHHLAEAGFYYTGIDDRVECPFCFGVLKKWQPTDVPLSEHKSHFPHCKFIKGEYVGNIPMDETEGTDVYKRNSSELLSPPSQPGRDRVALQERVVPNNNCHTPQIEGVEIQDMNLTDFTKEENRLWTFSRWPPNLTQKPDILARAGFYHIPAENKPDRVKCAYCKGKLYNWEFGDDPWIEHARCFPTCPYVKLCVGEHIITDLLNEHNTECESKVESDKAISDVIQPETESQLKGVTQNKESAKPKSDTNPTEEESQGNCLMQSEAAQAVLEMGFPSDLVQKAVEIYRRENPSQQLCGEVLASLVLEMEQTQTEVTGIHRRNESSNPTSLFKLTTTNPSNCQSKILTETSALKSSLREENTKMRDEYLCKICMENQVRVTFMPCGHLACCGPCSMAVSECPICRSPITGHVRTYF